MPFDPIAAVKSYGVMPDTEVDQFVEAYPGYVEAQWAYHGGMADTAFRKRHKLGLKEPKPAEVIGAVAQQVTLAMYIKRGFDDSSTQDRMAKDRAEEAKAWIESIREGDKELDAAADASPQLDEEGPLMHSMCSPYDILDEGG